MKSLPRRLDGKLFPEASASTVSHKFRALCRAAEIEGLRFHDLRHEATSTRPDPPPKWKRSGRAVEISFPPVS